MRAILNKFKFDLRRAGRPPAAIEIAPRGVLAAFRPAPGDAPAYAFQTLPADAVAPGVAEPNLRSPGAVTDAIRSALERISPGFRAVTVVLPDLAARVFLLEFDSLPDAPSHAVEILRIRLRKVVPFDVENAKIDYQMLPQQETRCRVLAVTIPRPILAEYEAAVYAAGYEPGAALPSSLAALAALHSPEPVLSACLSETALTTSIANCNDLLLYRTHELPDDPASRLVEMRRDIVVAAAYFEDKLTSRPQSLHYAGAGTAEEFARSMTAPGLPVVDLTPRSAALTTILPGANPCIAGVTGALAGAR